MVGVVWLVEGEVGNWFVVGLLVLVVECVVV